MANTRQAGVGLASRQNPAYRPAGTFFSHPVLIVQGTTDLQVTADNATLLASAQPGAKLVMIDGMNHALRKAPADRAANFATYRNPRLPLAKELVPALSAFVSAH